MSSLSEKEKEGDEGAFKKKILLDQDLWMRALHFHGPPLLKTYFESDSESESEIKDEAEKYKRSMCDFIISEMPRLFKPSESTSEDVQEPSIRLLPIEIYQPDVPPERKRDLFFKTLDRGDILILQVINVDLPDNYKLLAMCKEANVMKLDDLSIVMYLPKLPELGELELAGGKLETNDLIRAAVCSCNIDERKIFVTLHSNILDEEAQNVQLGKISRKDLPFYMRIKNIKNDEKIEKIVQSMDYQPKFPTVGDDEDISVGSSYEEYLHSQREFNDPCWAEQLHTVLKLKEKYTYSFLHFLDGKKYDPITCASELKKKRVLTLSNRQYVKAMLNYENGKFKEAFKCFNKALNIHPKNVEALVSRGILYANTNNLRKSFLDLEKALKINPNHELARKHMAILLVQMARLHMEKNDFMRAQESLDAAFFADSSNKDAVAVFEELQQRRAEIGKEMPSTSRTERRDSIRSSSVSSDRSDGSSSKKMDSSSSKKIDSSSSKILDSSSSKISDFQDISIKINLKDNSKKFDLKEVQDSLPNTSVSSSSAASAKSDDPKKDEWDDDVQEISDDSSDANPEDVKKMQEDFLKISTKMFMSSMKKGHHRPKKSKKSHHHSREKSSSKLVSPNIITLD